MASNPAPEIWRHAGAAMQRMAEFGIEPTVENYAIFLSYVTGTPNHIAQSVDRARQSGQLDEITLRSMSASMEAKTPASVEITKAAATTMKDVLLNVEKQHAESDAFLSAIDTHIETIRDNLDDPTKLAQVVDTLAHDKRALMVVISKFRTESLDLHATIGRLQGHVENEHRKAHLDDLTGLGNRRAFESDMRTSLEAYRKGRDFSLLLIDIDHFKSINDQLGHAAGDEALKQVAMRIRGALRPGDLLSRYGGEEFAVFLANADRRGGSVAAERIRQAVSKEPVTYASRKAVSSAITVSIGLAECCPTDTRESLIETADGRLYQAKATGRNKVISHGVGLRRSATKGPVLNAEAAQTEDPDEELSQGMAMR